MEENNIWGLRKIIKTNLHKHTFQNFIKKKKNTHTHTHIPKSAFLIKPSSKKKGGRQNLKIFRQNLLIIPNKYFILDFTINFP